MWMDKNVKKSYLAITAHWIALNDKTMMLVLRAALIAFHHVPGKHTGTILGSHMFYLLDRVKVTKNVGVWLYHDIGAF
jgi:hypothetical protein